MNLRIEPATRWPKWPLWSILLVGVWGGLIVLIHLFNTNFQFDINICIFKRVAHCPCPACGLTRAVFAFLNGQWLLALRLNPFFLVVLLSAVFLFVFRLIAARQISILMTKHEKRWLFFIVAVLFVANWLFIIIDNQ